MSGSYSKFIEQGDVCVVENCIPLFSGTPYVIGGGGIPSI